MTEPTVVDLLNELDRQLQIVVEALEGAQAEMVAAVVAEREECAKIADAQMYLREDGTHCASQMIARRIRARAGVSN